MLTEGSRVSLVLCCGLYAPPCRMPRELRCLVFQPCLLNQHAVRAGETPRLDQLVLNTYTRIRGRFLNLDFCHNLLNRCPLPSLLSQAILVREPRVHALFFQSKNHQRKRVSA